MVCILTALICEVDIASSSGRAAHLANELRPSQFNDFARPFHLCTLPQRV
jgi:hypothetical protein